MRPGDFDAGSVLPNGNFYRTGRVLMCHALLVLFFLGHPGRDFVFKNVSFCFFPFFFFFLNRQGLQSDEWNFSHYNIQFMFFPVFLTKFVLTGSGTSNEEGNEFSEERKMEVAVDRLVILFIIESEATRRSYCF